MKKTKLIAVVLLASIGLWAQNKKPDHSHSHSKTQKAHDHGSAQLDIAVDGKNADIEFHAPAMGLVGFEYVPTKAADKKKQAAALAGLKTNFAKVVTFDSKLGCKVTAKSVEINQEEPDHAEVDGDFSASCSQPLAGSPVGIDFSKLYPAYSSIQVQVVGANGSTGADLKGGKGVVMLPK